MYQFSYHPFRSDATAGVDRHIRTEHVGTARETTDDGDARLPLVHKASCLLEEGWLRIDKLRRVASIAALFFTLGNYSVAREDLWNCFAYNSTFCRCPFDQVRNADPEGEGCSERTRGSLLFEPSDANIMAYWWQSLHKAGWVVLFRFVQLWTWAFKKHLLKTLLCQLSVQYCHTFRESCFMEKLNIHSISKFGSCLDRQGCFFVNKHSWNSIIQQMQSMVSWKSVENLIKSHKNRF